MTALLYNNWRLCLPHLPQPLLNDWMRKVFLLLEISKPYSQDLMLSLKCSHCTFFNSKFCLIWESEYDQRRQRILSGGETQGRTLISVINFFFSCLRCFLLQTNLLFFGTEARLWNQDNFTDLFWLPVMRLAPRTTVHSRAAVNCTGLSVANKTSDEIRIGLVSGTLVVSIFLIMTSPVLSRTSGGTELLYQFIVI